ncbi:MAG: peptidase U32 family protein [Candidatus Altiarchaeota archaeon]
MSAVKLLSPAGDWDCVKAAVSEGADAVYFGLGDFNARRRAGNFTPEGLPDLVRYCHGRGVLAYLAANTLIKNGELKDWFRQAETAYSSGVDALIVQETPFLGILKESFPDMAVHVSTQAGVFNSMWADMLEGADMVVMPREMTLAQVREFHNTTGLHVEVFVQGALCFSISGQCLMSSFLGGRSGNRGLCAQPCRKRYDGGYPLSTADLCLVRRLPDVLASGVSALKIEGRIRSPEYVGAATAVYRRALDSIENGSFEVDEDAYKDLELSFSREYTLGGSFRKYDVSTPKESGKRGIYLGRLGPGGSIRLESAIRVGDGVGIASEHGTHGDMIRAIEQNGRQVSRAEANITVQLSLNAHDGDGIFLTSGALRRKKYALQLNQGITVERSSLKIKERAKHAAGFDKVKLLVRTFSVKEAFEACSAGPDRVYYSLFAKDYPQGEKGICPYVPRCLFEWAAKEALEIIEVLKPASVLCGDPGVGSKLSGCEVYLDSSANAFNDVDVGFYNKRGLIPVISPELTLKEISAFEDKRFAAYVHGRIPLMSTKYVLKAGELTDELGYTFPVRGEGDMRQVLNSVPFGLFSDILGLKKAGVVEYLLDLEGDVQETISLYQRILSGERINRPEGYTTGHFRQAVD